MGLELHGERQQADHHQSMDNYAVFNNTLDFAARNRSLLLHEIGHAMTLEHPGPYDAEGRTLPKEPHLPRPRTTTSTR